MPNKFTVGVFNSEETVMEDTNNNKSKEIVPVSIENWMKNKQFFVSSKREVKILVILYLLFKINHPIGYKKKVMNLFLYYVMVGWT